MPHTENCGGFVLSNRLFTVIFTRRFDSFNFDDQTWNSLSDTSESVLDLHGDSLHGGSLAVRVSLHIILVVSTEKVMMYVKNLSHCSSWISLGEIICSWVMVSGIAQQEHILPG